MAKIVINPVGENISKLTERKKPKRPWLRAYYRPFFFVALPVSILNVIFSLLFWKFLPPLIPLFYTVAQDADKLANKQWIFILPILAVAINFFHFLIIYFARHYDTLLLKIFEYVTIFIQLALLAITLRTILIVI